MFNTFTLKTALIQHFSMIVTNSTPLLGRSKWDRITKCIIFLIVKCF